MVRKIGNMFVGGTFISMLVWTGVHVYAQGFSTYSCQQCSPYGDKFLCSTCTPQSDGNTEGGGGNVFISPSVVSVPQGGTTTISINNAPPLCKMVVTGDDMYLAMSSCSEGVNVLDGTLLSSNTPGEYFLHIREGWHGQNLTNFPFQLARGGNGNSYSLSVSPSVALPGDDITAHTTIPFNTDLSQVRFHIMQPSRDGGYTYINLGPSVLLQDVPSNVDFGTYTIQLVTRRDSSKPFASDNTIVHATTTFTITTARNNAVGIQGGNSNKGDSCNYQPDIVFKAKNSENCQNCLNFACKLPISAAMAARACVLSCG